VYSIYMDLANPRYVHVCLLLPCVNRVNTIVAFRGVSVVGSLPYHSSDRHIELA